MGARCDLSVALPTVPNFLDRRPPAAAKSVKACSGSYGVTSIPGGFEGGAPGGGALRRIGYPVMLKVGENSPPTAETPVRQASPGTSVSAMSRLALPVANLVPRRCAAAAAPT